MSSAGEDTNRQPAASASAGTVPRRGEAVPVRAAGPQPHRDDQAERSRRQDPAPACGRVDRRARGHRQEDQDHQEGAHRVGHRPRLHVAGAHRHRSVGTGSAARRRRGHSPVPGPGPVRVLERHRTLDASSGNQERHRLSRAGNRRINRALHIMAIVQLRNPTEGRTYYDTRKRQGTPSMMAMRSLKRRLSNVVYARMLADQINREGRVGTGPRGRRRNDSD